jgi:hypothetical protein
MEMYKVMMMTKDDPSVRSSPMYPFPPNGAYGFPHHTTQRSCTNTPRDIYDPNDLSTMKLVLTQPSQSQTPSTCRRRLFEVDTINCIGAMIRSGMR